MTDAVAWLAGQQEAMTALLRDLRYVAPADGDEAMDRIEAIVEHASVPSTRASLEIRGEFAPPT